ncbi:MAG: hypothetical protein Q9226_009421 [Calogaya cf. arnoldii]
MDDVAITLPLETSTDVSLRALGLPSGEQSDITFYANGRGDKDTYRYLTGSEFNRKTVSVCFSIEGLILPEPFKTPLQRPEQDCDVHESTLIPDKSPWGKAAVNTYLEADNDIRKLEEFWKQLTSCISKGDVDKYSCHSTWADNFGRRSAKCDFTLPHNTRHHFMTPDWFGRYRDHGYYLILMIKRSSRYWDCLWDDIIHGAKEELVKVDDDVVEEIKPRSVTA